MGIPTMREMMDRVKEDTIFESNEDNDGDVVHYELDHREHIAQRGSKYVDPDLYKKGHVDYHPAMMCHTGNGHAEGTRDWSEVTCPKCLAKKK